MSFADITLNHTADQSMSNCKIFFYEHAYLRERQLDTVRMWPADEVINKNSILTRGSSAVSKVEALKPIVSLRLRQRIPLLNLKIRPTKSCRKEDVVYVWGGLMLTGDFIVEIDNPWCLVGYNYRAMFFWRPLISFILKSRRCKQIRCISVACRNSLERIFGESVLKKVVVTYPKLPMVPTAPRKADDDNCKFLFVGTQFSLKGGWHLVRAYQNLLMYHKDVSLQIISYLTAQEINQVTSIPGISYIEAGMPRNLLVEQYMRSSDVLVLPTLAESFGMVLLEALYQSLAIISTDVYAIKELVLSNKNGILIQPPINYWEDYMPSCYAKDWHKLKSFARHLKSTDFEQSIFRALAKCASDKDWLMSAKNASYEYALSHHACQNKY